MDALPFTDHKAEKVKTQKVENKIWRAKLKSRNDGNRRKGGTNAERVDKRKGKTLMTLH